MRKEIELSTMQDIEKSVINRYQALILISTIQEFSGLLR